MLNIRLNTQKNLLAFSAGIDSSALFFLLLEQKIPFDIAIVDYNVRAQSKQEITYAKELAKKYDKECFVKSVHLNSNSNFEKEARDIRYQFFETLISKNNYETLITAHQLDDKLEWFLMQLSKGAGLVELIGMQEFEQRRDYKLYRPLLSTSKDTLLKYLNDHQIEYFIDESNADSTYTRNKIRKQFSQELLAEFETGIKNSFEYLQKDLESLHINYQPIIKEHAFELFEKSLDDNINIRVIDKSLKKRGLLISKAQKDEILKQKELVVSHQVSISITEKHIYISPFFKTVMTKPFKESCRTLKIPKNIRAYLFNINFNIEKLAV